jgi:hypothetical protein
MRHHINGPRLILENRCTSGRFDGHWSLQPAANDAGGKGVRSKLKPRCTMPVATKSARKAKHRFMRVIRDTAKAWMVTTMASRASRIAVTDPSH